jgi:molybdate-binding protein
MGRLSPSTAAALALAAALECRVEDLFRIGPGDAAAAPSWAWQPASADNRYWQAEMGGRTLLYPYEATQLGSIQHDGITSDGQFQLRVQSPPRTLIMACCDPAVGLLAGEVARTAGIRLLAFFRSSRQAIQLLKQGLVHVAGVHLSSTREEGNVTAIRAQLQGAYRLVRVAQWEEGVATTADRKSSLKSVAQSRLRWVGREPGSGARQCLDELLGTRRPPRRLARDHRGVAEAVRNGWADAGVCLRLTAEEASLRFLPVREETYDLCFAAENETDSRLRRLLEAIRSTSYRRQIDDLPGYRAIETGVTLSVNCGASQSSGGLRGDR